MTLLDVVKLNKTSDCPGFRESDCGEILRGNGGTIDGTQPGTHCKWTVAVEYGSAIEITFKSFKVSLLRNDGT